MKAKIKFSSDDDLRSFLSEIGVPEQTTGKMRETSTFGEFTEAQLELARTRYGGQTNTDEDQGGRAAP